MFPLTNVYYLAMSVVIVTSKRAFRGNLLFRLEEDVAESQGFPSIFHTIKLLLKNFTHFAANKCV